MVNSTHRQVIIDRAFERVHTNLSDSALMDAITDNQDEVPAARCKSMFRERVAREVRSYAPELNAQEQVELTASLLDALVDSVYN